jgi:hypothetical protein
MPVTRKLAIIDAFQLLPKQVVLFITTLGAMRNGFAHGPRNVDLRIEEWARSKRKNNDWWKQLCAFSEELIAQSNGEASPAGLVKQEPRAATLVSALHTASVIYQKAFAAESARSTERARVNDLEAIALRAIETTKPEPSGTSPPSQKLTD